jgi:hypothetical protein
LHSVGNGFDGPCRRLDAASLRQALHRPGCGTGSRPSAVAARTARQDTPRGIGSGGTKRSPTTTCSPMCRVDDWPRKTAESRIWTSRRARRNMAIEGIKQVRRLAPAAWLHFGQRLIAGGSPMASSFSRLRFLQRADAGQGVSAHRLPTPALSPIPSLGRTGCMSTSPSSESSRRSELHRESP